MWIDFILTMTAPRVGWLSASGLLAIALLCLAAIGYASGANSMTSLVVAALNNLAQLTQDYRRNT